MVFRLFVCIYFFIVILPSLFAAENNLDEIEQKKQKLLQAEQNLKTYLSKLEEFESKEKTIVDELAKLDFQLQILNNRIKIHNLEKEQYQREQEQIREEIARRKTDIHEQESFLSRRLKAIYKRGEWTSLRLIFQAQNISEMAHTIKIMKYVAAKDLKLIQQHQRWIRILDQREKELVELDKKLDETARTITLNRQELLQKRRLKDVYLEQMRNKKEYYEERCAQIEKYRLDLEKWLNEKAGIPIKGSFQSLKNQLAWPVQGKIKRYFGRQINPRFQTSTFCNGLVISSEEGTPISAIADGVVQYAGWFQGYGNLVIIQHADDFFSLYGHLSELLVSQNDKIASQTIIGRVGDTGSDSGFVLYFELRHKGIPQNPLKWLLQQN